MNKKFTKIAIGAVVLIALCVFIAYQYRGNNNKYTQADVSKIIEQNAKTKQEYIDSLTFVRGQAELQAEANAAKTDRIVALEQDIDSLLKKHAVTKKKVKPFFDTAGVHAMLVPPEYVDECEACYSKLDRYKNENVALRFERDAYDTLMRNQISIHEKRIEELEGEKLIFNKMFNDCSLKLSSKCEPTRKVKISVMGMANSLFSPKGIGPGFIYEDKKENEYGGHVVFTSAGNVYLFNIAKTISFRRKK